MTNLGRKWHHNRHDKGINCICVTINATPDQFTVHDMCYGIKVGWVNDHSLARLEGGDTLLEYFTNNKIMFIKLTWCGFTVTIGYMCRKRRKVAYTKYRLKSQIKTEEF